jgi:GT2 family glycosyltransferase
MVSIIIVNYKSWLYLAHCLDSVSEIDNIEIIVVDNQSNDGQLKAFEAKFQSVKFIEADNNLGFGGACNLGAKHAKGNFLLFLNPDTVANSEAITVMHTFLTSQNSYKIVSCRQHDILKKHCLLFPNAIKMFGLLRALYTYFNPKKFEIKQLGKINFIEPDWVSGSVLMLSEAWFEKIGGWSKEFWMYSEDMDVCKKTVDLKGQIALLTDVQIFHKHGGATRKNIAIAAMTKTEVIKSQHVYYQKHLNGLEQKWAHCVLIFNFIAVKLLLAIIGLLFFFIPKLKLQLLIFGNLTQYYAHVFKKKTWLSEKLIGL